MLSRSFMEEIFTDPEVYATGMVGLIFWITSEIASSEIHRIQSWFGKSWIEVTALASILLHKALNLYRIA